MERRETINGRRPGESEKMSGRDGTGDMAVALMWTEHIERPCGERLGPVAVEATRRRYLREAKERLKSFTNPFAREFLETTIRRYEAKET